MLKLPLCEKQDSAKYSEVTEDPSMSLETEGGYTYTRPRYTRRPRKTWTIGFTDLTNEEKESLSEFYNTVKGGSEAFYWTHPIDKKDIVVRLGSQIKFNYTGVGTTYRWDTDQITIKEL